MDGSTVVPGCGDTLAVLTFDACPIALANTPVVRHVRRLTVGGLETIERPSAAAVRAVGLARVVKREAADVRRALENQDGGDGGR